MSVVTISDLKRFPTFFHSKLYSYKELYEYIIGYLMKNGELPKYGEAKGILEFLVDLGMTKSLSEARRLVQGNAVELDGIKISDCHTIVIPYADLIVKVGKRRYMKIVLGNEENENCQ